MNKNCEKNNST